MISLCTTTVYVKLITFLLSMITVWVSETISKFVNLPHFYRLVHDCACCRNYMYDSSNTYVEQQHAKTQSEADARLELNGCSQPHTGEHPNGLCSIKAHSIYGNSFFCSPEMAAICRLRHHISSTFRKLGLQLAIKGTNLTNGHHLLSISYGIVVMGTRKRASLRMGPILGSRKNSHVCSVWPFCFDIQSIFFRGDDTYEGIEVNFAAIITRDGKGAHERHISRSSPVK